MADDYVRMACAEVKFMTRPNPSGEQDLNKNILVGGGITGNERRTGDSPAGYSVHIVERAAPWEVTLPDTIKSIPTRSPLR